ncbi:MULTISPECIES: NAD+ synthase [Helicobacter]|mgnify:CR=1 FL=1|uniref:NH(3)-dependent NAD(+) synthetase n=2 Tax=Helicobacter typhlonius TaxID=76936 RepID=A0A099UEK5_9HELI|nr:MULTISPECIES: NAD+ synthase [Helicobacter]TLD78278.1 NAD+ synthase [Helicobacter typhlonius]TLD87643.1 NAD+ synthase [Helicobacter sp. MIT 03-1616]CUU38973.1 NAD synthetase [Helicobacter typhlonius]HCD73481.1 NAD+ synthase [Helicobacter sp.]
MDKFVRKCSYFLKDEFDKRGFKRAVLGLSGGLDSALVATLGVLALGKDNVRALLMPSLSSSQTHFDDALLLTRHLDIEYRICRLAPFQKDFAKQEGMDLGADSINLNNTQKQRMGNFCARMRMALLYDCASADNALVLGTSNKSEILLGYGTIFGDLASAINPIGNLYKTQVFALSRFLNVPEHIICKKPSADLYSNQSDEGDLGYSYERIDSFLRAFVSRGGLEAAGDKEAQERVKNRLCEEGFEKEMVEALSARVWNNAFKRAMPLIFSGDFEVDSKAQI